MAATIMRHSFIYPLIKKKWLSKRCFNAAIVAVIYINRTIKKKQCLFIMQQG